MLVRLKFPMGRPTISKGFLLRNILVVDLIILREIFTDHDVVMNSHISQ